MSIPQIRSFTDIKLNAKRLKRPLILFSGGLDGAYLLMQLKEFGIRSPLALTVDLGDTRDHEVAANTCKALDVEHAIVDFVEPFVRDFVAPSIPAQAIYCNVFPVHATLSRPALALCAVQQARILGCDAILHTSTASQNSLRRFNGALGYLFEERTFGSPFEFDSIPRSLKRSRLVDKGLTHYAERSVSIDSSIYGVAFEAADLDDPESFDFRNFPGLFPQPRVRPATSLLVGYEQGIPIATSKRRLALTEILKELCQIGYEYGLGWYSGVEENGLGEKVHEVRIMAAAEILLRGYRFLESAILPFDLVQAKSSAEQSWIAEAVEGRWFSDKKVDAERKILSWAQGVSGDVQFEIGTHYVRAVAVTASRGRYSRKRND